MYALEKTTFDITKANFVVFGAVMLISNTSYFAQVYGPHRSVVVAVALISLVSLAASVLVTLFHLFEPRKPRRSGRGGIGACLGLTLDVHFPFR